MCALDSTHLGHPVMDLHGSGRGCADLHCVHSRVWSIGSFASPWLVPLETERGDEAVHSRVWQRPSAANEAVRTFTVCTPGSGPSALLAGVLCALLGLVHQLYWLGFCVHTRVWSIGSIGWGSVCIPGSGPSALLAGVLCALLGLIHWLHWLGFCVHSRVWTISSIGWDSVQFVGESSIVEV